MERGGFVEDRFGDVQASRYGGAEPSHVPKFRRVGEGRILGLNPGLRIATRESKNLGEIMVLPYGRRRSRYVEGSSAWKAYARQPKKLSSYRKAQRFDKEADYIPIEGSRTDKSLKPESQQEAPTWLGYQFAGTEYRSNIRKDAASDDSTDESSSSEQEGESGRDSLKQQIQDVEATLRSNPVDVQSWLVLVKLQADIAESNSLLNSQNEVVVHSGTRKPDSKGRKAIAEVQLSVLDRALRSHKDNQYSVPLLRARMDLIISHDFLDKESVESEWRDAIQRVTLQMNSATSSSALDDLITLYQAFLHWYMSEATHIFSNVLLVFGQTIASLVNLYFERGDAEKDILEQAYLTILGRLVCLLEEAGYIEKARGVLQAESEVTFQKYQSHSLENRESFDYLCVSLQEFWELEEPRIGDADALGFHKVEELSRTNREELRQRVETRRQTKGESDFRSIPEGLTSSDGVERWRSLDKARGKLRSKPSVSHQEPDWTLGEMYVDPFSYVFYADVEPFLFPLRSQRSHRFLLDIYATHLGSPAKISECIFPLPFHLIDNERFWSPSLGTGDRSPQPSWMYVDGELMDKPRITSLDDPFSIPFKSWPWSLSELYKTLEGLPWFASWDTSCTDSHHFTDLEALLRQSIGHDNDTYIYLARLGLAQTSQKHKSVVKLAKQILSDDRHNILLWLAFAQIQANAGESEKARTVYRNALLQSTDGTSNLSLVWAAWGELEWSTGDHMHAQGILVHAALQRFGPVSDHSLVEQLHLEATSPMDLLRARRVYKSLLTDLRSASPSAARAQVSCAALLEYISCSADDAFEQASKVFDEAIVSSLSRAHVEMIALSYAKLIWRHTNRDEPAYRSRRFVPRLVREKLRSLLELFPHNSGFLALFAAFDMSAKFENGLRRSLDVIVKGSHKEPVRPLETATAEQDWLHYLYIELHMHSSYINENAVRAIFERALSDKSCQNSSLLWRLYVRFEELICRRLTSQRGNHVDEKNAPKEQTRRREKQQKESLSRAKRIIYRAIGQAPFCKEIYMTAFAQPLRAAFTIAELQHLADALDERYLRTFANLDAFVDPADSMDSQSSDTDTHVH